MQFWRDSQSSMLRRASPRKLHRGSASAPGLQTSQICCRISLCWAAAPLRPPMAPLAQPSLATLPPVLSSTTKLIRAPPAGEAAYPLSPCDLLSITTATARACFWRGQRFDADALERCLERVLTDLPFLAGRWVVRAGGVVRGGEGVVRDGRQPGGGAGRGGDAAGSGSGSGWGKRQTVIVCAPPHSPTRCTDLISSVRLSPRRVAPVRGLKMGDLHIVLSNKVRRRSTVLSAACGTPALPAEAEGRLRTLLAAERNAWASFKCDTTSLAVCALCHALPLLTRPTPTPPHTRCAGRAADGGRGALRAPPSSGTRHLDDAGYHAGCPTDTLLPLQHGWGQVRARGEVVGREWCMRLWLGFQHRASSGQLCALGGC